MHLHARILADRINLKKKTICELNGQLLALLTHLKYNNDDMVISYVQYSFENQVFISTVLD